MPNGEFAGATVPPLIDSHEMTRATEPKKRTEEDWKADLESDDEARVIAALHQACPCTGSAELYEKFLPVLNRFKKDQRAGVRKVALHLEVDAFDRLRVDEEEAVGVVRNRPGGNDGRRNARRPRVRDGEVQFRRR